jgi:hypothetical protein
MKPHWTPLRDESPHARRWADLRAWLVNEQAVMERWADERVPGSAGQQDKAARAEMAADVLAKMTKLEAGR